MILERIEVNDFLVVSQMKNVTRYKLELIVFHAQISILIGAFYLKMGPTITVTNFQFFGKTTELFQQSFCSSNR